LRYIQTQQRQESHQNKEVAKRRENKEMGGEADTRQKKIK